MNSSVLSVLFALAAQFEPAPFDDALKRDTHDQLYWQGQGSCQPDEPLRTKLVRMFEEAKASYGVRGETPPRIKVRLNEELRQGELHYTARISSQSSDAEDAQWQLAPASCALLHSEIVEALSALLPHAKEPSLPTPPKKDEQVQATVAATTHSPRDRSFRQGLHLGLDAGSQMGPFPGVSMALGLSAQWSAARFVLEGRGRFSVQRPKAAAEGPGAGVDTFQQYLLQLSPCLSAVQGPRLRLPVCVGGELGVVHLVVSERWNNAKRNTGLWAAATLGARIHLLSNSQSSAVSIGVDAWFTRPGAVQVHSTPHTRETPQTSEHASLAVGGRAFIEISLRAAAWTGLRRASRAGAQLDRKASNTLVSGLGETNGLSALD